MKKTYIKLFSALLAVVSFTSCGDFLDEVSQDEFKPETVEDYQEILNGEGYGIMFVSVDPLSHVFTDDVQGADMSAQSWNIPYYYTDDNLAFKDVYTWQPDMDQLLTDRKLTGYYQSYQDLYKLIMACNTVLGEVDKATGTDTERKRTKGEALALRAYYYWYLVNLYAMPYNMEGTTPDKLAGVPLVLTSEIKNEGPKRSSVAAVYGQITADIEEACSLLEEAKSTTISNFRINWMAAHLLASRIYLYMENWDQVISHVDKAMSGHPVLCDLNTYSLAIPSNLIPNPYNSWADMASNNFVSSAFPETLFVGGSTNKVKISATLLMPSEDLFNSFTSDDLRKKFAFKETSMYWKLQECKAGSSERGFAWRTAELYLNSAEAYAEKFAAGDAASGAKAVNEINALRKKRIATASYQDYTLGSAEELIQFIHAERRRELCFENPHRWFDLRRYGMPKIEHPWFDKNGNRTTFTLEKNDVGYALPFPVEATTNNPNLEQNPVHAVREGM